MVVEMLAENRAGVDVHGTVEEHGNVGQAPCRLEPVQIEEKRLGTADGKSGDDRGSTTAHGAFDDLRDHLFGFAPVVAAIAVGRLDEQVVCIVGAHGIDHHGIIVSTDVAGEGSVHPVPLELDGGGAQDVAGAPEADRCPARELMGLLEGNWCEAVEGSDSIGLGVERQRRLVLGKAMAVGVVGVLFLQVPESGSRMRQSFPVDSEQKTGPAKPCLTRSGR